MMQNEENCLKIRIAHLDENMRKSFFRWFVYVQRWAINAPMRKKWFNSSQGNIEVEKDQK